jgi:hypothetical protein
MEGHSRLQSKGALKMQSEDRRADHTAWILSKRRFTFRMTLLVGFVSTVFMIIWFKPYDAHLAIIWVILAAIGLLGGYISSLLMWKFFISPTSELMEPQRRNR